MGRVEDHHPVRVGIVGAGANTRARHLPGLQQIPGVEVVVVCNRSEASSQKVAGAFHIPRIASHWRDVVEASDVDAVVIGTWPSLHAEVTCAALTRGKHVLTEARMASTLAEAAQMCREAARHPQVVAQIVPAPMSLDVDETIRRLVDAGELGVLREVVVTHTSGLYADSTRPLSWRQDTRRSGINILTFGILAEMLQRWLGEDPEWVAADGEIFTRSRVDPATGAARAIELPDTLRVVGHYRSGARVGYRLSGVEPGAGCGEMRLHWAHGSLRFELESGALYQAGSADAQETPVEIPQDLRRGWRVEEDFIASIRTGAPVRLTDFDQGLRYMTVMDAVWRSWKRGGCKIALSRRGDEGGP